MLQRLGEVDYEIAPGQPDVRGWDVVLGNDEQIGVQLDDGGNPDDQSAPRRDAGDGGTQCGDGGTMLS
ncbi:MAG TPA: hypothetical protein VFK20_02060 [Vicinamibacterales bacterium]|nr:hypothetical protein [Vicinamibacterales bacterium]